MSYAIPLNCQVLIANVSNGINEAIILIQHYALIRLDQFCLSQKII